jgi:NAD(P)-dependent dehydrogenase (short-subunit alcohol dehydrogenase family)
LNEMPQLLTGKRVLLTGTGRGQGEVIQSTFASMGANVVGCDIAPGAAEASAAAVVKAGFKAWGKTVDLGDPVAAAEWVNWGAQQLGGIDVLFNNASRPVMEPFDKITLQGWQDTIRNELDLVFYVTVAAWPHLAKSPSASVITTASASGKLGWGSVGQAAHSAAKAGVIGFTKQLASEGGRIGIRANTISPGYIKGPGTAGTISTETEDYIRGTLQLDPRPLTAEDIAMTAAFLASDLSRGITGEDIAVDAGWAAGRP